MKFDRVKDSGAREKGENGVVRDSRDGKGRYDLLPARAIRRIAMHYENGAKKYGDRNWEGGLKNSRCIDSAIRHLFNALEGQTDEDHLAAAAWNILAIIDQQERIESGELSPEFDDLPKKPKPKETR